MILSFNDDGALEDLEPDVLVIGGGAVGLSILADRVLRGERTVLLEAGGRGIEDDSQEIFRSARSVGHPHEGIHVGRFRLLGGTTHFWGGQLGRFDPIVFEPRDQIDGQHWPFEGQELTPYYDRAMTLLGMDAGMGTDKMVCEKARIDDPGCATLDYFFTRWVREPSLAHHFTEQLGSPLATVITHANVVGFAPLADGGHEIVIRSHRGHEKRLRARAIVLACGTMEISRLLLMPYADGSLPPWHANPFLGRCFYDHAAVVVGDVKISDKRRFDSVFENVFLNGYKYNPKLKLSEKIQRDRGLLQACGAFIFATSYKHNAEMLRHFMRSLRRGRLPGNWFDMPRHFFALAKVAVPMVLRYLRSNRAFHPRGSSVQLQITVEQIPIMASHLSLTTERDRLGMPTLELDWQLDGRELETVAVCAEEIKQQLEALGLATVDLDPRVATRDRALLAQADDTNHQMGGARMGASAAEGVVDSDLKVFGTRDIFVAGAAAMPTSGFVNCTLTAIALGLRLADHLRKSDAYHSAS
jgi:hypothetical protein